MTVSKERANPRPRHGSLAEPPTPRPPMPRVNRYPSISRTGCDGEYPQAQGCTLCPPPSHSDVCVLWRFQRRTAHHKRPDGRLEGFVSTQRESGLDYPPQAAQDYPACATWIQRPGATRGEGVLNNSKTG